MIKKTIFFVLLFTVLYMLLVNKEGYVKIDNKIIEEDPKLTKVITTAQSYKGVSYKFGGTTKAGMDCSGLLFTSFKDIGITLPRSSRNMYYEGKEIELEKVKRGDLLFFDTNKFEGNVNHVGMVTSVNDFEVNFIHSSNSKGVTVTSLNESYWKKAFIKAKRILD